MNDLSWVEVTYHNFSSIPEKPGVYLIVTKCTDNKKRVIYSGQSTNLYDRIPDHWCDSEANKQLKDAIQNHTSAINVFYAVTSMSILDETEKYLFDHFKPQFQDRAPEVEPVSCSLPDLAKGKVNFN